MTGTPHRPVFSMVTYDERDGVPLYEIHCDEGWRRMVVCREVSGDWLAKWILECMAGRALPPVHRRKPPRPVQTIDSL